MCYTSAAAARTGAKEALANGVLILLVPPMVFFAVIAVVVYMYRNKYRETFVGRPKQESPWGIEQIADFRLPIVDFSDSQSAIGNRKSTMGKDSLLLR